MIPELKHIIETDAIILFEELYQTYNVEVPIQLVTPDDIKKVQEMMGRTKNEYAYLNAMFTGLCIIVKNENDVKKKKELITKRDLYERYTKEVKFRYDVLSRMLSAKMAENEELKMTGTGGL